MDINTRVKLKQFGKNITELRLKYNMSIEELSIKSGIRKEYLIKIENGVAIGISMSHLEKLTDSFDGNIKEILKNL